MREKILEVLKAKGHRLTPGQLLSALMDAGVHHNHPVLVHSSNYLWLLADMEQDKLVILHRGDGSAGTAKGEITLVVLRLDRSKDA